MMKHKRTFCRIAVFISLVAFLAANSENGHAALVSENFHQAIVSGGVVHPAFNSAVFQNPAGLVYIDNLNVGGELLIPESGDVGFGGQALYGNKSLGGAVGLRHYGTDNDRAMYGLGVEIDAIRTSFGLAGETVLKTGSTGFNLGTIINTTGRVRLGAVVYGIGGGIDGYGAGAAVDITPNGFAIVTDATTSTQLKTILVKPGFVAGVQKANLTASYGFVLGRGKSAVFAPYMAEKFSAGVSVEVMDRLLAQAYYEQVSRWYIGLTYKLR